MEVNLRQQNLSPSIFQSFQNLNSVPQFFFETKILGEKLSVSIENNSVVVDSILCIKSLSISIDMLEANQKSVAFEIGSTLFDVTVKSARRALAWKKL